MDRTARRQERAQADKESREKRKNAPRKSKRASALVRSVVPALDAVLYLALRLFRRTTRHTQILRKVTRVEASEALCETSAFSSPAT